MLYDVLLVLWYLSCFLLGIFNRELNTMLGSNAFFVGVLVGIFISFVSWQIKNIAKFFGSEVDADT